MDDNTQLKGKYSKIKNDRATRSAFLRGHKIYATDIISIVVLIVVLLFVNAIGLSIDEAIVPFYDFTQVYMAKEMPGSQGTAMLDSGHERIIVYDLDNRLKAKIYIPVDDACDYLYIDDFAADSKGNIYVAASEWDGMNVARETIIKYSSDFSEQTKLVDYEYYDKPIPRHRIMGLSVDGAGLTYVIKNDNSIDLTEYEEDTVNVIETIEYDNAYNAILEVNIENDAIYALDKSGVITKIKAGEKETVYDVGEKENEVVPYEFAVDEDGSVFFIDIKGANLRKVVGIDESVVMTKTEGTTVNAGSMGRLYLCGENDVEIYSDGGSVTCARVYKNTEGICLEILTIAVMIVALVLAVYVLTRFIYVLATLKVPRIRKIIFAIVIAVGIIITFIALMMLDNFSDAYEDRIVQQLELCAHMVSGNIKKDDIDAINGAKSFESEEYQKLVTSMEEVFLGDNEFCKYLYCTIVKMEDDGTAHAICYLDQTIGTYYPLSEDENEMIASVYDSGESLDGYGGDASGTYLYVKYPVIDSGEVIGVVEVGIPDYIASEQIDNMKKEIIAAMIVVMLLVGVGISEGSEVIFAYERYKKEEKQGEIIIPGHMLRILIFVIYIAYNMTVSFLPVYVMRHSAGVLGINESIAAALPVTVNIFVIGLMSLPCAKLVRKFGIKKLCAVSALCSVAGNALIFFIPSYGAIFTGLIFDGIGVGVLTNATYILIALIKDEVGRIEGFSIYNGACNSGVNFGIMAGSVLALNLSHQEIFGVVAGCWVVIIALIIVIGNKFESFIDSNSTKEESRPKGTLLTLFKDKKVVSFYVLIQNTYIVFTGFVFYYLPIFCDECGYSEATVSVLLFVFSEIIVFTGGYMTKLVSRKFKEDGVFLGIGIAICGVMIFAALHDMIGMVIALLMLAVADSFQKPISLENYMNMDTVKKCGEDNAIGVYNFTENIGQSLGPSIFARVMSSTPMIFAVTAFSGVIVAMSGLYKIINPNAKSGEKKHEQE